MKVIWALTTILAVTTARLIDGGYNTKLNHFDHLDNRMVHFPYQINLDYYEAGGPLFIYVNAATYVPQWVERGLMVEVARATHGALITTNQRFFGLNQPTEDTSYDNLKYLSADLVTYDVPYLIQDVKRHLASPNARVIIWGAGHGGASAIWARQNFPFLIDGAWSSSGKFRPVVFTTEYYDYLEEVITQHGGADCRENIRLAFQEIHNRVVAGNSEDLINTFSLCEPWNVTSRMDVALFFQGLVNIIEQNIHRYHLAGITNVCSNLTIIPNDPYTSFGDWVRVDQEADLGRCLNYDFTQELAELTETSWDAPAVMSGLRQRLYSICVGGAWFYTTHQTSIFANHISQLFYYRRCIEPFAGTSYQFVPIYNFNKARSLKYGSSDPNISKVIITNGELDPSFKFGISQYNASDSLLFNYPYYGRSPDMYEILPTDSEMLVNAKQEIFNKLVSWATEPRN